MSRAEFYVFHNKTSIELYPIQFGREACAPRKPITISSITFYLAKGAFHW